MALGKRGMRDGWVFSGEGAIGRCCRRGAGVSFKSFDAEHKGLYPCGYAVRVDVDTDLDDLVGAMDEILFAELELYT